MIFQSVAGIMIQLSHPGPTKFPPPKCAPLTGSYAIQVINPDCSIRFYISASEKDGGKIFLSKSGNPIAHDLELGQGIIRALDPLNNFDWSEVK